MPREPLTAEERRKLVPDLPPQYLPILARTLADLLRDPEWGRTCRRGNATHAQIVADGREYRARALRNWRARRTRGGN